MPPHLPPPKKEKILIAGAPHAGCDRLATALAQAGMVFDSGAIAAWHTSALRARGLNESGWLERSPLPLAAGWELAPPPLGAASWLEPRATALWPLWQQWEPEAPLLLVYRTPDRLLADWLALGEEPLASDPQAALRVGEFYSQALLEWAQAAGERATLVCADAASEAVAAKLSGLAGVTVTLPPQATTLGVGAQVIREQAPAWLEGYDRLQALAAVPGPDLSPDSPAASAAALDLWAAAARRSRQTLAAELAQVRAEAHQWHDRNLSLDSRLAYARLQAEQARAHTGRYQFQAQEAAIAARHFAAERQKVATQLELTCGAIGALESRAAYYQETATAHEAEIERGLSERDQLQAALWALEDERDRLQAQLAQADQHREAQTNFLAAQIEQTRAQYAQAQAQFRDLRGRLEMAQQVVVAMQTSKFWQLRNGWFALKRKLKLPTTPEHGGNIFAETARALAELAPLPPLPGDPETVQNEVRSRLFERVRDRVSPPEQHATHVLLNLFDARFYADRYPDVASALPDSTYRTAFEHFVHHGSKEGRDPSPLFETVFYLKTYPQVTGLLAAGRFASAIEHFVTVGMGEGYRPSPLFDPAFYLATYPDVAAAVETGHLTSAFEHYLLVGVREGRLPCPLPADEAPPVAADAQVMFAFISGCGGAPYRYRCQHQAEVLRYLGYSVEVYEVAHYPYGELLERARVWVLHRTTYHYGLEKAVQEAHDRGIRVIFESDDLVFDPTLLYQIADAAGGSEEQQRFYEDMMRQYQRTIALADGVSVSTPKLAAALAERFGTARVAVLPNRPDAAMELQAAEALAQEKGATDGVRLGYFSGTQTHQRDFAECAPALREVLARFPQVRLCVVGAIDLPEDFLALGEQVERLPLLPAHKLAGVYRSVDVNLAPLERDSEFTQGKSEIKYLEAALLNVPTIASRWAAYETAMTPGQTGWLCGDHEEWVAALTEAITDAERRRQIGIAAGQDVRDRYLTRAALGESWAAWRSLLASPLAETTRWSVALLVWVEAAAADSETTVAREPAGAGAIAALARRLGDQGHTVNLYLRAAAGLSDSTVEAACQAWEDRLAGSAVCVRDAKERVGASDVAIATHWATAYRVDELVNTRVRLHWVFEDSSDRAPAGFPERDLLAAAYALPLRPVAAGPVVAAALAERAAIRVPLLTTPPAIDPALLASPPEVDRHAEPARSLLWIDDPLQPQREREGAIAALAEFAAAHPEVEVRRWVVPLAVATLSAPYTESDSTHLPASAVLGSEAFGFECRAIATPPNAAAWAETLRTTDLAFSGASGSVLSSIALACAAAGCPLVQSQGSPHLALPFPSVQPAEEPLAQDALPSQIAATLDEWAANPLGRQALARRAREAVESWTADRAAAAFEEILHDVLFM